MGCHQFLQLLLGYMYLLTPVQGKGKYSTNNDTMALHSVVHWTFSQRCSFFFCCFLFCFFVVVVVVFFLFFFLFCFVSFPISSEMLV